MTFKILTKLGLTSLGSAYAYSTLQDRIGVSNEILSKQSIVRSELKTAQSNDNVLNPLNNKMRSISLEKFHEDPGILSSLKYPPIAFFF